MADESNERKAWTDSDRALAYVLYQASFSNGKKIGDRQCKIVARSRKVTRTEGSWSRKLTNYIQADKFIKGLTPSQHTQETLKKRSFRG